MALTEIQLRNLISFNIPDNIQGLVTPFKIREVMNEMVTKAFDSQLDSLVADNPLSFNATTKTLSMPRATAGQSGYLHAFDFAVFNTVAGDYVSQQGEYHNPSWLAELSWNKIINTPTSLSGYGITDPVVLASGNYTDPSWIASLAYSKLTGAPVLGTVSAINTNGNGNTYLAGDGAWKTIDLSGYVTLSGTQTISGAKTFSSVINAAGGVGTTGATNVDFFANNTLVGRVFQGTGRWSIGYASPVDNGFRVDISGTLRATGLATLSGGVVIGGAGSTPYTLEQPAGTGLTISNGGQGSISLLGANSIINAGTSSNPEYRLNNRNVLQEGTSTNLLIGNGYTTLSVRFSNIIYGAFSSGGFLYSNSAAGSINASAVAQFDSTTKGVLVPRMTTAQRTAIASPSTGLIAYDTDINHLCFHNGTAWQRISHSPA